MRKFMFVLAVLAGSFAVSPSSSFAENKPAADDKAAIAADDHGDPVLKAMLAELKRSQEKLQLGQMQRPYYIDYQVIEYKDFSADAILGALRSDRVAGGRLVRVVVRIGDYKQDSYYGEGVGSVDRMPTDNNEMALRRQLWLATDQAYKAALGGLSEKQAALKNLQTESEVADFSQEKPTQAVRDPLKLDIDVDAWKKRVRATSDLFRRDPTLDSTSASFGFRLLNRYFVNTEGTATRNGKAFYTFAFSGSAQADDAMRLERSRGYMVVKPEELPKPEDVEKDAQQLIATFAALRKAPLVEDDYRGPVLFSADAATALFERMVVPNILGIRPELGNPARTRGEFASYYKNRVLPDFLTVIDDPSPRKIDGQTLAGSYDVDDEGTVAQPVTVIDKGVLSNFLLGREPIRDFPHSNGHGRSSPGAPPRAQISNLIFSASSGSTFDDLKKKLVAMCKDQGKPYGYFVETTGPQLAPRLLWRVYVNDGHMELIRGAVFHQLDTRALRNDIIAAGNDVYVYNRAEPLPSSIVAPSLLFGELELQRANRTKEKLPNYPPPALSAATK